MGPLSGSACAGRMGEHKHRAFPSRRQSLRAATGSLEENVLPLLRYRLSSRVKKVLMLCRYWAVTTDFFSLEMECPLESAGSCCQPKPRPSLRSVLRSFIGLWVKLWPRNKTACSESNPVQGSRSKSTTCPRRGRPLRFKLNSTATSDGWEHMLENDISLLSGVILNRQQPNRSQMKCYVWMPCCDQCWQDELRFLMWAFFEQSSFINIHLLCYRPTIHDSILKICPKFQVFSSHFFKVDELLDELSKNCAKWKYFNSNLCPMQ